MRRIARGIERYVLNAAEPFIIRTDMVKSNAGCVYPIDDPLRTISTGGSHALVVPTMVQTGYGERRGQDPRCLDLHEPIGTMVNGQKHALVAALLAKHYGGPNGHATPGQALDIPIDTVTGTGQMGPVVASLVHLRNNCDGRDPAEPMPTTTAGGIHVGAVCAFLSRYNGTAGDGGPPGALLGEPIPTLTSKPRFGLVTVEIDGQTYAIADIGMRMLQPRELFRAQGFVDRYVTDPEYLGKPLTKAAQVRMVGNSVCPDVACAIVGANCSEMRIRRGQGQLFNWEAA
jgi:DNA (cytosine-5)-methyltransferase 1